MRHIKCVDCGVDMDFVDLTYKQLFSCPGCGLAVEIVHDPPAPHYGCSLSGLCFYEDPEFAGYPGGPDRPSCETCQFWTKKVHIMNFEPGVE